MKPLTELHDCAPIRLGISSCLLGEKVRYDTGHKLDHYLLDTLGRFVDFVPVCPEMEFGLGTPREAMRLVGNPENPKLITVRTGIDHTDGMVAWARERVRQLEGEELCGFVFKSNSPSSGMTRVKVYDQNNVPKKEGVGIFARIFMQHFPLLPVEDEGRLHDAAIRENFIESVFTFRRLRQSLSLNSTKSLIEFHTRHKLLIRAHDEQRYTLLGKLIADAGKAELAILQARYRECLMQALSLQATRRKHTNVLYHIMGYFKKNLCADEKQELRELIEHYHAGHFPLVVPLTLLNHYVRKYDEPYLHQQYYLHPHPIELQLRNHV